MDTADKLEVLRETFSDKIELEGILGKLLETALSRNRLRLQRYEQDLRGYEKRFGMDSESFYRRFESGELGDAMDFFEWSGVYEMRKDLLQKIRRIEATL